MEAPSEFRLNSCVDRHCYSSARTNAAALIRAIRGASSFGVDPGSGGVRSGADAARPFTNGGLAKLSGMGVQNVILPNTQSINRL